MQHIRSTVLGLVTAVLVLAGAPTPAAAHGDTIRLELSGAEDGRVTTVATWENDHDPVTEEFAGTLSARSADGRTAGPWRLVAVPGRPGAYTTREMLPAGHWKVAVDCAFPSLGHGERELDVAPAAITDPPLPTPTAAAPTASAATPTPATPTPATPAPAAPVPAAPTQTPTATPTPTPTPAAASSGGPGATAAWAAVATAVTALLLVALGHRLRRRRRP